MSRIFQKKVKALAESKKAMKEELSRLQMGLKNMTEEESQLLEGTSNKFPVVELTKTASEIEGASEIEIDHSLSEEHEVRLLNQKASPSLDLEQTKLKAVLDVCNGRFFISSKVSIVSDSCFSANKINMRLSNN